MDNLALRSAIAGVCWGIWPFLLQKSGLTGNVSSFVFTAVILLCIAPFIIGKVGNLANANWGMAIIAGICSAIGLLSFNGMLAKAPPEKLGSLFVVMIVVQTVLPVTHSVVMGDGLNLSKTLGFGFALLSIVLLARGNN